MGRPLRTVKGYTVAFRRGTLLFSSVWTIVYILGMQLEIPNDAWDRYIKSRV